eukprot:8083919-Pyramimonas_sp.AAC.1
MHVLGLCRTRAGTGRADGPVDTQGKCQSAHVSRYGDYNGTSCNYTPIYHYFAAAGPAFLLDKS